MKREKIRKSVWAGGTWQQFNSSEEGYIMSTYENYKLEFGYMMMSILIEMIRMAKSMRGHVATKAAITWLAADQQQEEADKYIFALNWTIVTFLPQRLFDEAQSLGFLQEIIFCDYIS